MKKEKTIKKLVLKKEKVTALSNDSLAHIKGGGGSTNHNLTCGLCTNVKTKDVVATVIYVTTKL